MCIRDRSSISQLLTSLIQGPGSSIITRDMSSDFTSRSMVFLRSCDIEDMKKALVNELGPDVNLANVPPASIIDTEATRTGLGTAGPPRK